MSYCRWADDSNVYVIGDSSGRWRCVSCDRPGAISTTMTAMIAHLQKEHLAKGDLVPDRAFQSLRKDIEQHGDNWNFLQLDDEHPERRAEPCKTPAAAGPAPVGPVVGLDDTAGKSQDIAAARSSWPFAHEVIKRSVERQEIIDRQYAHIPVKVVW